MTTIATMSITLRFSSQKKHKKSRNHISLMKNKLLIQSPPLRIQLKNRLLRLQVSLPPIRFQSLKVSLMTMMTKSISTFRKLQNNSMSLMFRSVLMHLKLSKLMCHRQMKTHSQQIREVCLTMMTMNMRPSQWKYPRIFQKLITNLNLNQPSKLRISRIHRHKLRKNPHMRKLSF